MLCAAGPKSPFSSRNTLSQPRHSPPVEPIFRLSDNAGELAMSARYTERVKVSLVLFGESDKCVSRPAVHNIAG